MPLTTAAVSGRFPMPDDQAFTSAVATFRLSGFDTEGDAALPPAEVKATLVDGELPAGFALWCNTEGLRGTYYAVTVRAVVDSYTPGFTRAESYVIGNIQIPADGPHTIADLLNNPVPDAPSWNVNINGAEYAALVTNVATGVASAPYASRAALIAANVPSHVNRVAFYSAAIPSAGVRTLHVVRSTVAGCATSNGGAVNWSPDGDVTVDHFGAVSYKTIALATAGLDSAPMFQAAVNWMLSTTRGGLIRVGADIYCLRSQITIAQASVGFAGAGLTETFLIIDHTAGAGIRWTRTNPRLHDIAIQGSDARDFVEYVNAGENCGIRLECEDVINNTSLRLRQCEFMNVNVTKHPSHGIVMVGAVTGVFTNCSAFNNGGHGYAIGSTIYTRTNRAGVPSMMEIVVSQITGNGGHGVYIREVNDISTPGCRIDVRNCEINDNAQDATARLYPSQIYAVGAQLLFERNVLSAVNTDPALLMEGWYVAGNTITLRDNRHIGCYRAGTIGSDDGVLITRNVEVDGLQMIGPHPVGGYDPLVLVMNEAGGEEPNGIDVKRNSLGNTVRLIGTDATMGSGGANRVPGWRKDGSNTFMQIADQSSSDTTFVTITDLRVWLTAGEVVRLTAHVAYTSSGTGDIRLRVAGAAGSVSHYGPPSGAKYAVGDVFGAGLIATAGDAITFGGTASERYATLAALVTNGSTAGWVNVQFAQSTLDAVTPTVVKGGRSMVTVERIVPQ